MTKRKTTKSKPQLMTVTRVDNLRASKDSTPYYSEVVINVPATHAGVFLNMPNGQTIEVSLHAYTDQQSFLSIDLPCKAKLELLDADKRPIISVKPHEAHGVVFHIDAKLLRPS